VLKDFTVAQNAATSDKEVRRDRAQLMTGSNNVSGRADSSFQAARREAICYWKFPVQKAVEDAKRN
jgi:hypothetical protein